MGHPAAIAASPTTLSDGGQVDGVLPTPTARPPPTEYRSYPATRQHRAPTVTRTNAPRPPQLRLSPYHQGVFCVGPSDAVQTAPSIEQRHAHADCSTRPDPTAEQQAGHGVEIWPAWRCDRSFQYILFRVLINVRDGFGARERHTRYDERRHGCRTVAPFGLGACFLRRLYERHGVAVRRYVVSRVGVGSGEDLAAEVFIRAFRARDKCRADRGSALPWLLGVASHVIGDPRRLERRRLATLERLLVEGHELAADPDTGLTVEMIHALRRLSVADRDTLLLLVWGELSRDEVAVALGVPVGTVNSRIARARKRLVPTSRRYGKRRPQNCG